MLPSLEAFNDAHVLPWLDRQEELRAALQAGDGSTPDLYAWAARTLLGLLRDEQYLIEATHGLGPEHAGCYVSAIDNIDDVLVTDVRALSPMRRLVVACARVRAVLDLDVDWEQYSRYAETRAIVGDEPEPFSTVSWYETADLFVWFSLVLDEDGSDIITAEIDGVEGRAGTIQINERPPTLGVASA